MRHCATCGSSLEGRSPRARYCSNSCRAKGRRNGDAMPVLPLPLSAGTAGRLTSATRSEAEALGVAGSALAESALTLALQIDALPDPRTLPNLNREWRATMAELRAASVGVTVNPLDELRRRRESRTG